VLQSADGTIQVYELGSWPAPFGIVLVLDRLSALMVLLTSIVGFLSLLHSLQRWDRRGKNFHALFQFQLMGINGAFLTGDLFNLFVFFEILLIASFGLLLHGGGTGRIRSGVHYVVFNLAGSAFFLIAIGILYGTLGTLNMADLAVKVETAGSGDQALIGAGAFLLLLVFSVKAALLPLYFWLPGAYSSAVAPVAALFSIMTKVGVYAILRIFTLVFHPQLERIGEPIGQILILVALLTLLAGSLGVLASRDLGRLVAYLVIVSVGTLLVSAGLFTEESLAAAVYYLIHSTIVIAALFLLLEGIATRRGNVGLRLEPTARMIHSSLFGTLFFTAAIAVAGMPPLSGFLGKLFILKSAVETPFTIWVFSGVLTSGLLVLIALVRAGSLLFWKTSADRRPAGKPVHAGMLVPVIMLLLLIAGLTAASGPVFNFATQAAAQLLQPAPYIETVLDSRINDENSNP